MDMLEALIECTVTISDFDHMEISCRKGLWSVGGPDKLAVLDSAMHYFIQYYHDGEYEDLLAALEDEGAKDKSP